MKFYPCFISFRHYGDDISESFIRQFEKCLSAELIPLVGKKPFVDFNRLSPGYSLSQNIKDALCQSACMIVIWSPQYFTEDHLWCAMEFKAMMELEQKRLKLLPQSERGKKLIIPVIYRGSKYYPLQLEDTLYLNFEKFALYDSEMIKNDFFADRIRDLAEYIYERVTAFKASGNQPWGDCGSFNLPSKNEAKQFIKKFNLNNQGFPF
jgi:TIR domain